MSKGTQMHQSSSLINTLLLISLSYTKKKQVRKQHILALQAIKSPILHFFFCKGLNDQ